MSIDTSSAPLAPSGPKSGLRFTARNRRGIWWINPSLLIMFITLPVFLASSLFGGPIMHYYGALNFIDPGFIWIGVGCLLALAGGAYVGARLSSGPASAASSLDALRTERAILALAWISILCHLVFLAAAFLQPALVVKALSGNAAAAYGLKRSLNKIPGITSFMQLFLICMPLYGAFPHIFGRRSSSMVRKSVYLLGALVFLRAFVGFERFSIIEFALATAVPRLAYSKSVGKLVGWYPAAGFAGVLGLFSAGEFFRTWTHYKNYFSSFPEFISVRLLGYICTSTNNAAGLYQTVGTAEIPYFTMRWFHKLPLWSVFPNPFETESPLTIFFEKYGNDEFNNPSGLYSSVLDYGAAGGIALLAIVGVLGGVLYSQFNRRTPTGIMLFPVWFLGFIVITQLFYWGDPRVFPVFLALPFVVRYVKASR